MNPPPDQLRQEFESYNRDFRISTSKVGCLLAFVLMPAGTVLDWFVYPEFHGRFLALRLACAFLAGILYLLLCWPAFAHRWFRELGLSWFVLPSAFICWMIYESEGVQSPYYAGLTLVLIAVSWVAQVTVLESATAFVLTLLMYLAACFGHGGTDPRMLFNNLYFIVLTGVVMLTGNYFLNRMRFREFALRQEVDAGRREIEASHRRLLELDQMKSRFFANISHELRTPLTLLLAPLERLRTAKLSAAETTELTGLMHGNALRLLKLINDLLDLVRMQSGQLRLDRRALDLAPFLNGLAQSVRSLATQKRLTVETALGPHLGRADLDSDKLEKILLNLLFNAIKFTPSGGRIRLCAQGTPDEVRITVEDNGPGIPEAHQARIFDPFWQEDLASTRKFQGAGLGLALVKELTEAHGGHVRLESQPGQGARFEITLPRSTPEAGPVPSSPAAAESPGASGAGEEWLATVYRRAEFAPLEVSVENPAASGPAEGPRPVPAPPPGAATVLVADDEPQMLRFIESQLAPEFHVLTARDGMHALHLARSRQPGLIVLDYMMPAMDGLEVCRALRAEEATRAIPIILLTARADEESRLQTLEAGATDFLTKPFSSSELTVRCRNLAGLHAIQRALAEKSASLEKALLDLREAEEQLVHSAKMASLGQLSAGLLHEVNNPLNFAQAALLSIQRSLGQIPDEALRGDLADMLGDLGSGLRRAVGIVSGLKEFAHPDMSSYAPVQMKEVIDNACTMLGHLLNASISVEKDIPGGIPAHGNRNQLVHLCINLLHNAADSIRSRPPGAEPGRIRITWSAAGGNRGLLEVWDNGPGIPRDVQARIFEPFFTTKPVGSGVGLGLSTCYRIAQTHGGSIRVESEPGKWCRFLVDLPLTTTHPTMETPSQPEPAHAGLL